MSLLLQDIFIGKIVEPPKRIEQATKKKTTKKYEYFYGVLKALENADEPMTSSELRPATGSRAQNVISMVLADMKSADLVRCRQEKRFYDGRKIEILTWVYSITLRGREALDNGLENYI